MPSSPFCTSICEANSRINSRCLQLSSRPAINRKRRFQLRAAVSLPRRPHIPPREPHLLLPNLDAHPMPRLTPLPSSISLTEEWKANKPAAERRPNHHQTPSPTAHLAVAGDRSLRRRRSNPCLIRTFYARCWVSDAFHPMASHIPLPSRRLRPPPRPLRRRIGGSGS